jgi:hypothetical protein
LVGARVVTPGDWNDLDLDPATRHTSIRRAVRRALAADPGLEGNAVRLITLLDDLTLRACDAGAFFCSSLVLQSDSGGLLAANMLMQISADAETARQAGASALELCAGLAAAVSCDAEWAGADVTVVTLPAAGPAVRVEVVAGGVCVQYLVPIPDSSRQIVLTFTSPCPPYAGELIELFDSMAASFALNYRVDDDGPPLAAAPDQAAACAAARSS